MWGSHHQPPQQSCHLWPVWADTVMDSACSEETGNGCSASNLPGYMLQITEVWGAGPIPMPGFASWKLKRQHKSPHALRFSQETEAVYTKASVRRPGLSALGKLGRTKQRFHSLSLSSEELHEEPINSCCLVIYKSDSNCMLQSNLHFIFFVSTTILALYKCLFHVLIDILSASQAQVSFSLISPFTNCCDPGQLLPCLYQFLISARGYTNGSHGMSSRRKALSGYSRCHRTVILLHYSCPFVCQTQEKTCRLCLTAGRMPGMSE